MVKSAFLLLVKPGGILSLSAVGGANFYRVGNLNFLCTRLNGQDVLTFLCENEFTDIDLRIRQVRHAQSSATKQSADSKPDFTISLSGLVLLRASEEKQHLPLLQQLPKLNFWYDIL